MRIVGRGWRELDAKTKSEYQRLADQTMKIPKPSDMTPQEKKKYARKLQNELKVIVSSWNI